MGKTSGGPKSVARRQRQQRIVDLRIRGLTFREIAAEIGMDVRTAYTDLRAAVERYDADLQGLVEDYRQLEVDRLDKLQAAYWQAALDGDISAAKMVLKVIAQRARLLKLEHPEGVKVKADTVQMIVLADGQEIRF